jgi:hypothetical protein
MRHSEILPILRGIICRETLNLTDETARIRALPPAPTSAITTVQAGRRRCASAALHAAIVHETWPTVRDARRAQTPFDPLGKMIAARKVGWTSKHQDSAAAMCSIFEQKLRAYSS